MSENTRKAVVTTAQVQEALNAYNDLRGKIGLSVTEKEFDKGARGKGFATYDEKGVQVRVFETKEEALMGYRAWHTVVSEVLTSEQVTVLDKPAKKTPEKAAA
jgi:hypothetical protein